MTFFSHRAVLTASLVTFAMYLVFFVSSSPPAVLAVVAATTADAEFTFDVLAIAVLGVVVWVFDFDFDNVTVVQSWQSGTSGSGVLYLFFDMTGWWTAGEGRWMDEEVVCIVSRDRFISVYRTDTDIDAIIV